MEVVIICLIKYEEGWKRNGLRYNKKSRIKGVKLSHGMKKTDDKILIRNNTRGLKGGTE